MARTTRTQQALQSAARWIVTAVIVLCPWLFAGAGPASALFLALLVDVAVVLWLLSVVTAPVARFTAPLLTAALALLIAFVALQAAPLPAGLVRGFAAVWPRRADAQPHRGSRGRDA